MIYSIPNDLILKLFHFQRIRGYFYNEMRYLLTYLLFTYCDHGHLQALARGGTWPLEKTKIDKYVMLCLNTPKHSYQTWDYLQLFTHTNTDRLLTRSVTAIVSTDATTTPNVLWSASPRPLGRTACCITQYGIK